MTQLETIKELREKTGAGIVDVKQALEEAGGDAARAIDLLKQKGMAKAVKKSGREAREGVVVSYIHSNARIGVLLTLLCETDFVARTDAFRDLAKDIAMHIAAMNPSHVRPEDVAEDIVEHERGIWREQAVASGKTGTIAEKMLEGKERKFREELSLLTQPFVKNPDLTVGDLIAESVQRIGENIQIGQFVRYEL